MVQNGRYCRDCDKTLPLSEFYIANRNKDGSPVYRGLCKKHYNKLRTHPELARAVAYKPLSRSDKSRRRTAFARILEGL